MKKSFFAACAVVILLLTVTACDTASMLETGGSEPDIYLLGDSDVDNSKPPALQIEVVNGDAVSAAIATMGGYSWRYPDKDGIMVNVVADADRVPQMREIIYIDKGDGFGRLITTGKIVSITSWAEDSLDGEGTSVSLNEGRIAFPGEGAFRYEIIIEYDDGTAHYGFAVED